MVRALALFVVAVVSVACGSGPPPEDATPRPGATADVGPSPAFLGTPPAAARTVEVAFGEDAVLRAEVAADAAARRTGLMHRTSMPADAGMLFLFPAANRGGFWMKDTLIPLSIAFMDRTVEGFQVLAILDMEPCEADPCRVYDPEVAYDAALEANAGWFADHDVGPGDTARVEGDLPDATT